MNILLAVHHFPPRYTGGAEWRAHRTAKALQALGHQVSVITVERIDAPISAGVTWQDDVYEEVAVRRLSFNMAAAPDPFRWEYDNPWLGEHVQHLMEHDRPDVLHVISGYMLSASVLRAAERLSVPTVLTLTDFWFLCRRITLLRSNGELSTLPIDPVRCVRCLAEESRRYRWAGHVAPKLMNVYWSLWKGRVAQMESRMSFLRDTLQRVDAIISPSLFLRSVFVESGVPPERVHFSRQGRDFLDLTPEHLTKTAAPVLRVGYIGQIAQLKGVHVLVKAVKQLPAAALSVRIFGDPTPFPAYTAQLREQIRDDRRIELVGVRTAQELSRLHRELDIIVMPSVWYENSPNVILEAFAHHTPVISSDLGGMSELVQHGKNGLLFAPGDANDLAKQLRRLLEEPELLTRLRSGIEPGKSVAQEMAELEMIYRRVTGT